MNTSKLKLSYKDISLEFNQETLRYSIEAGKVKWETRQIFLLILFCRKKRIIYLTVKGKIAR